MGDPRLPPSRFGVGHTTGGPAVHAVSQSPPPAPSYAPPLGPSTPAPAPDGPTNRLALLAFIAVVGLGPLAAPLAVPTAVVASRQCAQSRQRGAGLAKAAVFIGVAYLVFAAVVVILRLLPAG